jgi:inorganic phosphate transporter, PiT family
MDWFVISLVVLALVFDFINGFHDSANSVATIVSTRILSPKFAVLWSAFFNFIAFLFFGLHVAGTIGKGIVDVSVIDKQVIFGALMGAIFWDLITWWLGLPSSSSHALIGGLIGSALVKAGMQSLIWTGIRKILIFIVVAPVTGFVLGMIMAWLVFRILYKTNPFKVDKVFRVGQLISAAMYSLGHGGNDAQKTMGIIASLLFTAGYLGPEFHIPLWIVLSCHGAIALGTMLGGWRIVKTMGQKLSKMRPVDGFCAETGAAVTLYVSTALGVPVSTTHTITGSILGIGTIKKASSVKWKIANNIIIAWILTIPAAAIISAFFYWVITYIF